MRTHRAASGLVNGVFEGGGAKALAFAGALRAVAERGIWFGSVAGSSAGAINASLIAAGLDIDQLERVVPDVLAAANTPVAPRIGLAIAGRATSLFDSGPLRRCLDDKYAQAIGHDRSTGPVTFRQLHLASGIELYVVALDLATGVPTVFSRRSTPDVDVAGAVAASSAIPTGFPAARLVMERPGGGATVHQFVDGATWANYPSFVFGEQAFRTWLRGESEHDHGWSDADEASWVAETDRPLLGFVFGEPDPPLPDNPLVFVDAESAPVDHRSDLGPAATSSSRGAHLIGATLSSDWARSLIGLALLVWVALSIATLPLGFRRYATWLADWMPDPVYPAVLVGSLAIVVLAAITAIAVIGALMVFGRLVADTILPVLSSIIGIPTGSPPWIGLDDDSVVLWVPREGLSLVGFDVDEATVRAAVAAAHDGVASQLDGAAGHRLDELLAGAASSPVEHDPSRTSAPGRPSDVDDTVEIESPVATVLALVLIASSAVLGWWVTTSAGNAGILQIVGLLAASVVVVAIAVRYVGDRARLRAHARANIEIAPGRVPKPAIDPVVMILIGFLLTAGGLAMSAWTMNDRGDDTVVAEVIDARSTASTANEYVLRTDDSVELTIRSDRHLRLGERTFISVDDDGASLAGALDDARFAVAVALVAVGIGVITAGAQARRWVRRNRQLAEVVENARSARTGSST